MSGKLYGISVYNLHRKYDEGYREEGGIEASRQKWQRISRDWIIITNFTVAKKDLLITLLKKDLLIT